MADKKSLNLTLPSDREFVMTRVFDAPRELVFKAHTDPNLIPQWWGSRDSTTTVEMEVKPGGVWRFVSTDSAGNEYGFNGVYREIVPPERLVYTFEFEGMPGLVLVETITFEDLDGKTRVTDHALFDSLEDRDRMLNTGMEDGAAETWERLDELLAKA